MGWSDAPIMPTPGAVGLIMQTIAEERGINILGVDIGGATTDVFNVFGGIFNRTVSANLGMSYSVSNVLARSRSPCHSALGPLRHQKRAETESATK